MLVISVTLLCIVVAHIIEAVKPKPPDLPTFHNQARDWRVERVIEATLNRFRTLAPNEKNFQLPQTFLKSHNQNSVFFLFHLTHTNSLLPPSSHSIVFIDLCR